MEGTKIMKYAITAATGRFGIIAVNYLTKLVDPKDIVIIARNFKKAQKLFPNLTIRTGNYDRPNEISKALSNIDRVLFISSTLDGGEITRLEQHKNVVSALKRNHVSYVAYTSFTHAQNSKSSLANDHKFTENLITDSKISHSFLRNNWYLENETNFLKIGKERKKAIYWTANQAGWALEREYAEAAVKVLVNKDAKEIYEFSGPAHTYEDLGLALNQALNYKCDIMRVTKENYIKYLEEQGLSHQNSEMYASFQNIIDEGSLSDTTNDLAKILNHPLTKLSDGIKEIIMN